MIIGKSYINGVEAKVYRGANLIYPIGNPNLIINGTFTNGLTGWSSRNSILTVEDFDGVKVVKVADSGAYSQAYQSTDTVNGLVYALSFDYAQQPVSTQAIVVDVYDGDGEPPSAVGDLAVQSISSATNTTTLLSDTFQFTATSNKTTIALRSNSGNYDLFTNIILEVI